MAIIYVDNESKPIEVQERIHISDDGEARNLTERYLIDPFTSAVTLAWEWITAYIFTKDSFGVQTKDGYIIKCTDQ